MVFRKSTEQQACSTEIFIGQGSSDRAGRNERARPLHWRRNSGMARSMSEGAERPWSPRAFEQSARILPAFMRWAGGNLPAWLNERGEAVLTGPELLAGRVRSYSILFWQRQAEAGAQGKPSLCVWRTLCVI